MNESVCKSCGAPVVWRLTAKGKRTPDNPDGSPHWQNCPQAKDWKRKG